jgi:hypothetical protein
MPFLLSKFRLKNIVKIALNAYLSREMPHELLAVSANLNATSVKKSLVKN